MLPRKMMCIVVLLMCSQYSFAQNQCIGLLWDFPHRDTLAVFSDKALVRKGPSSDAVILDSLPCGTQVKVTSTKEEDLKLVKVSGYHSYWLPVQYKVGNAIRKGFVWSGSLAITDNRFTDKRLMVGMGYVTTDSITKDVVVKTKLLDKDGKEIWAKELEVGNESIGLETKVLDGMGLSNVQKVFRIMSSGEACGVPTDFKYFAWMVGDSIVALPSRYCVADAGAFYYDESFVFPSESGGKPGRIIKNIESAEYDENDKPIKKKKEQLVFVWDGKRATSSK